VFNERQLTAIYGILNIAMRHALGLLPNFYIERVQRPLKEMGLGVSSMRDRATHMGIEHLARAMNKDTERGFTAHAHVHRSNPNSTIGLTRLWSLTPSSSPLSAS
jgi:hypothetical protein